MVRYPRLEHTPPTLGECCLVKCGRVVNDTPISNIPHQLHRPEEVRKWKKQNGIEKEKVMESVARTRPQNGGDEQNIPGHPPFLSLL